MGLIDLPGVIIPKKTIFELCKLLTDINEDIVINIDPNKIIFYIDNTDFNIKIDRWKFSRLSKSYTSK